MESEEWRFIFDFDCEITYVRYRLFQRYIESNAGVKQHLITAFLTAPTAFAIVPIIFPLLRDLILSIYVFSATGGLVDYAWPDDYLCRRDIGYPGYPDYRQRPPRPGCLEALDILRVLFCIGGIGSVIIL